MAPPPNILHCLASKVLQVVYVSLECPALALKSCFGDQNIPKFEDFHIKSKKKFGEKAPPRKFFLMLRYQCLTLSLID